MTDSGKRAAEAAKQADIRAFAVKPARQARDCEDRQDDAWRVSCRCSFQFVIDGIAGSSASRLQATWIPCNNPLKKHPPDKGADHGHANSDPEDAADHKPYEGPPTGAKSLSIGPAPQQFPRRRTDKGSDDEAGKPRRQGADQGADGRPPRLRPRRAISFCAHRSRVKVEEQNEAGNDGPNDNRCQAVSLPASRETVEEITRVDEKDAWNDRQDRSRKTYRHNQEGDNSPSAPSSNKSAKHYAK